jgi:hypothetical protein
VLAGAQLAVAARHGPRLDRVSLLQICGKAVRQADVDHRMAAKLELQLEQELPALVRRDWRGRFKDCGVDSVGNRESIERPSGCERAERPTIAKSRAALDRESLSAVSSAE